MDIVKKSGTDGIFFVTCVLMVWCIHNMNMWLNWGQVRVGMWCWVVVCKLWCITLPDRYDMQDINVRVLSILGEMLIINDIFEILHGGE